MGQFGTADFPDPFEPVVADLPPAEVAHARSLRQQRARRAMILATTRRMLAQTDHERLTLSSIAEQCGVAVQTIRNSFGRREDLIVSAVNEHTTWMWQEIARQLPGPLAFMEFARMLHSCAVRTPGFLRGALSVAFTRDSSMQTLQAHAVFNKTQLLKGMIGEGCLRPRTDIGLLAAQITKLDTMLMYEWSRSDDAEEFGRQLVAGHGFLLRGAFRDHVVAGLSL